MVLFVRQCGFLRDWNSAIYTSSPVRSCWVRDPLTPTALSALKLGTWDGPDHDDDYDDHDDDSEQPITCLGTVWGAWQWAVFEVS
jgi:hypothetical protein